MIKDTKPDILIIGAGAAGLMAASRLSEAGYKIAILEARHRLGGRIWTDRSRNFPIELGAEFIHGKPKEIFSLLKKSNDLKIIESLDRHLIKNKQGFSSSSDFWNTIHKLHQHIDPYHQESYSDFLKKTKATPFQKQMARSYIEGFHAAEPDFISTEAILAAEEAAQENGGETNSRIAQGYDSLISLLAASLAPATLHLENIVQEIRWQPHQVEVTAATPNGEKKYRARKILITVPLGVLQAKAGSIGAIDFQPELPSKKEALNHLKMGHVLKFIVISKKCFWDKLGKFGFLVAPDIPIRGWWTQEPTSSKTITGWVGGPFATKASLWKTSQLIDCMIDSLATVFSIDQKILKALIKEIIFYSWSRDPFTSGAYSYPGLDGLEAARTLGEPIADTLFFAGEATDFQGNYGTVHGALRSGLRAAQEIYSCSKSE